MDLVHQVRTVGERPGAPDLLVHGRAEALKLGADGAIQDHRLSGPQPGFESLGLGHRDILRLVGTKWGGYAETGTGSSVCARGRIELLSISATIRRPVPRG